MTTPFINKSEAERQQHFIKKSGIVGQTIKAVRYMTDSERDEQGWFGKAVVIELSNGTIMYPMKDDEGNGAGAVCIQKKGSTKNDSLPIF